MYPKAYKPMKKRFKYKVQTLMTSASDVTQQLLRNFLTYWRKVILFASKAKVAIN
jgi:hypothetical protein